MDSGVGVKAYAVIEQGKIGQILGARPTERRQLLEEAAGVTKYKSRRRAAELKLDSARQNLTRVDDIVYEVEKQRRSLKRQAARARRYRRLREELRRWETLGFARRHGALAAELETARTRLAAAREVEEAAAARVATVEGNRARRQIELAEGESGATRSRDAAHALDLAVERRPAAADLRRPADRDPGRLPLRDRGRADPASGEARAGPERARSPDRRGAPLRGRARDGVGATLQSKEEEVARAQLALDGLDGDVEAARSEVFAVVNAATALQHAIEHASASHERLGASMAKLDAEGRGSRHRGPGADGGAGAARYRGARDEGRRSNGSTRRAPNARPSSSPCVANARCWRGTSASASRGWRGWPAG